MNSTVARTNPELDAFVRHLGYESVDTDDKTLKTDFQLVMESQQRLEQASIIPDRELSPTQKACLNLTRELARDLAPRRLRGIHAAVIPPASDRVRTAGLYSRRKEEIFISTDQLQRGKTAVDTGIHEIAHHNSGAEDGAIEHQTELSRIGEMVASRAAQGRYDKFVADPSFTW
ncbi:MAG: hypothetical protein PHQ43_06375 [Dehalococcoidales bacterium]|nr:hypothetical protein [Dehalococcoidales bacterium]